MADDHVDTDYAGRPIARRPITDADREASAKLPQDATIRMLDGRPVWRAWDGTFELDADGGPDRRRPIDHEWPMLLRTLPG